MENFLRLLLKVTAQSRKTSSWRVTFSNYGSVCLEFFGRVISETKPDFGNMNLIFLLAARVNSLVDSFPIKYMPCWWSLIWLNCVWGSWYLIIWLKIPVQCSAMGFWTVTFSNWRLEAIVWNFVSGESFSKPSWISNISKIPVAFKLELWAQYGTYAVFKFNLYKLFRR